MRTRRFFALRFTKRRPLAAWVGGALVDCAAQLAEVIVAGFKHEEPLPLQTREQGVRSGRRLPRRNGRDVPRQLRKNSVKVWKRARGQRQACHQVQCNFVRTLHKYRGYFGDAAEVRVSWNARYDSSVFA